MYYILNINPSNMRSFFLFAVLALSPGFVMCQPFVYPNLQEWTAAKGNFKLSQDASIVYSENDYQRLQHDLLQFKEDLESVSGMNLALRPGEPQRGDIQFVLDADIEKISTEGYLLDIGKSVVVRANLIQGIFYGMQSLLQVFKQDSKVPMGKAIDYPLIGMRGLMLDVARDFFEVEYIETIIRKLAWMKMNFIHIHFTDREAFRLKSDLFPGLAHPTEHYTKDDIRRLQDYAARYHIMLIPEIEMPAHGSSYTDYNPYLAFNCASMRVGHKVTENFESSDQVDWKFTLDITRREVRTWLKAVLDEWIPLFDAQHFHIGGDEWQYDANKYACPELMEATNKAGYEYPGDLFVEFTNEMNDWVKSHGKTTHIWNWWRFSPDKGKANEVRMNRTSIQPDKDIIVHVWNYPRQQEILDDGYKVIISSEEGPEALYSTPYKGDGKPGDYGVFQNQKIYEEWIPKTGSSILGYKVCLWTDTNDGRADEWYEPYYNLPIAVLAEKTWGSRKETSIKEFEEKVNKIGVKP
jgi:N-acetyl-beta-hexosaminidase